MQTVAEIEGVTFIDIDDLYTVYKLASLTGWSIEYIDNLSILHREAFLQIYEAEEKLKAPRKVPTTRRKR